MKTLCKRLLSLLLVFVLVLGLMPSVYAATDQGTSPTTDTTTETTIPEETGEGTVPEGNTEKEPDETISTVSTEESTQNPDETTGNENNIVENDSVISDDTILSSGPAKFSSASNDYAVMAAATESGYALFDYTGSGYTTRLSSQLAITYKPNGTGSSKTAYLKNLGWHFSQKNNVPDHEHPLYCIEPYRNFGASTSGHSVERGATVDGSGSNAWYAMPESWREAIGLILLYTDQMWDYSLIVKNTPASSNTNIPLRIAAQFLIYEIVCGLRNPDTFELKSSNGYVDGDILYNAGVNDVSGFAPCYNSLVNQIQAAMKIPSFTGATRASAPTITLNGEETSVYDSNEVLQNFSFSDGNGASFDTYGNTLYITKTGTISPSTVYTATRYLPSAYSSSFNVFYMSGSTYQTTVSLYSASTGSLSAYFKLDPPEETGSLSLVKTTEDGLNLSGWQFGIYSNSGCTSLVSGPHTTNSSGRISVTGLNAGTYYVKELGHTNSSINSQYTCTSTNPQKVTITAGSTASVSFNNSLIKGGVKLIKTTNTGKNVSGWKIGLYTNSSCTAAVSGSPFTTGADGSITVPNLAPGKYYAKEVAVSDRYWDCDTAVRPVTVVANQTASVTFKNNHFGDLRVKKNAVNGSAQGWNFQILDANKTVIATITTGSDGYATSGLLEEGTYYVREVHDKDETYWTYDVTVEKQVTVTAGSQAQVEYTNEQFGRIRFCKTTNTGSDLAGWTFRLTDSDGNVVGEYTTDSSGYATTGKLKPGRYTVVELETEDNYWVVELGFHPVTVVAGKTVDDEWFNKLQGKGIFHKTTNTGESLEGWKITVYSDEACTDAIATVTTDETGSTALYLDEGTYYAKETGDENGRFENEYWLVDTTVQKFQVKVHEDTEVYFSNKHLGKIDIVKTMETDGPLGGWQFKITDYEGNEIDGSPFTSADDGTIVTGNIEPGEYIVEELIPEDSPYCCISENPQKVTVKGGEIAKVSFTNALRSAKITIHKVDTTGKSLAGAVFLLEWSDDGEYWIPVVRSTSEHVKEGTCTSPNIVDGKLTSGEDGLVVFDGLYPSSYYRITEVSAPEGFQLLEKPAFEGKISQDNANLEISMTVVNARIFTLPQTGSRSLIMTGVSLGIACALCAALLIFNKRKYK